MQGSDGEAIPGGRGALAQDLVEETSQGRVDSIMLMKLEKLSLQPGITQSLVVAEKMSRMAHLLSGDGGGLGQISGQEGFR